MFQNIDICTKNDMVLSMIKTDQHNKFKLQFTINNKNYNLRKCIGFKLFTLIGEVNLDVIENIYIAECETNTTHMDVSILLKPFGKEIGLAQKYMSFHTVMEHVDNNTIRFISEQIEKPTHMIVPDRSEPVLEANTMLDIAFLTPHEAVVTYEFTFVIDEDLPNFMEKYSGLLMKKIFLRLKTFLENINENSL